MSTDGAVSAPSPVPAEGRPGIIPGYEEFEIDVEAILRMQLPAFFESFEPCALTPENVAAIPERAKGAYVLLLDGQAVYAGKTDTRHGFRDRLNRHAFTIKGRVGLDPARIAFKAVRIMVFSAFDVEAILIAEMKRRHPGVLAWNNSGFGSNDPGRNRDGQEPADFDRDFPIDVNFIVEGLPTEPTAVTDVLRMVKERLPYLLRYKVFSQAAVAFPAECATVRETIEECMRALPAGHQATILHGRVIVYAERKEYEHKLEVIRS